jgi:DNA-binding response OmpR family regulator
MYKILIVEDEPEIARLIRNRLDGTLFGVTIARNAEEASEYFERRHYDLVTLDIMLPGTDGMALCRSFRARDKETLILMVTALGTEEDIETGYACGADDYICKPFSPKTLAVKIQALLNRRSQLRGSPVSRYGVLEHDARRRCLMIGSEPLLLTPSEYTILTTLLEAPKSVFSRDDLAQVIYDNDLGSIDRRGIDTHVYNLRKKIAALSDADVIKTVRQFGYTLHEH